MKILGSILTRIILSPFTVSVILTSVVMLALKLIFNYFRYGGEYIFYTNKVNRTKIIDVYEELVKQQEKN